MRVLQCTILAACAGLMAGCGGAAQEPIEPELRPAHASLVDRVEDLMDRALWQQAAELAGEEIKYARRAYGRNSAELCGSLDRLAVIHEYARDYAAARQVRAEAVACERRLYGADHWRVADASAKLARIDALEPLTSYQFRRWSEAEGLLRAGMRMRAEGNVAAATVQLREALAIQRRLFPQGGHDVTLLSVHLAGLLGDSGHGEEARRLLDAEQPRVVAIFSRQHPLYLSCLHNRASLAMDARDFVLAESLARESERLARQLYPPGDIHVATAANLLGLLLHQLGDNEQAARLLEESLAIQNAAGSRNPVEYAALLTNLGVVYQAQGRFDRTADLLQRASELNWHHFGPRHPRYALALNNLAMHYFSIRDFARCEETLNQAVRILETSDNSRDRLVVLNNQAMLYEAQFDYPRALPLLEQVAAIRRKTLAPHDLDLLLSLNNLGYLYYYLGDYDRAATLLEESLELHRNALDPKHPQLAGALHNLADVCAARNDLARAEQLQLEALAIDRQALGEDHPDYANDLTSLGFLYFRAGEPRRAEPLFGQALSITWRLLELAAAAQSERQQLAMADALRQSLSGYLTLAADGAATADHAYAHALLWKGAVWLRQRNFRQLAGDALADGLLGELAQITTRLSTQAFDLPEPDRRLAWQQAIDELTRERERLESQLARLYRRRFGERPPIASRTEDIQAALPPDTVLVDYLQYDHYRHTPGTALSTERRMLAFVLAADRPPVLVSLGPAEPIANAVDAWRRAVTSQHTAAVDQSAAEELSRLVWRPVAEWLPRGQLVLISPDGPLARVPFAALPGRSPGSRLLEQQPLAVIPVPRLLSDVLTPAPAAGGMLVMGDIDFAAPGPTATHTAGAFRLAPLPATRLEIELVASLFRGTHGSDPLTLLRGTQATESALRQHARPATVIHLATHGFFAPPGLELAWAAGVPRRAAACSSTIDSPTALNFRTSASVGMHSGLLSGLALAGANRGARLPATAHLPDDGILTALELAELPLANTRLLVLSACDTALGRESAGEGPLGLQRAAQVAGARTTIATLWQVDDVATQVLMAEFYRHLWHDRLGTLEALRQAQLTMLRRYDPDRGRLLESSQSGADTLSPYYWAALVLSGDWR